MPSDAATTCGVPTLMPEHNLFRGLMLEHHLFRDLMPEHRLLLSSTSFAAFDVDQSFMQVGTTHNKLENKHRKLCNYFFYYSGWR